MATTLAVHRTSLQMSGHKTCAAAIVHPDQGEYYGVLTDCLYRALLRLRLTEAKYRAAISAADAIRDMLHPVAKLSVVAAYDTARSALPDREGGK